MPYRYAKFERNQSTGRLFYVVQKFFKSCAKKTKKKKKKKKEKKNVKKIGQFLEVYILFTTNPISFTFYM